MLLHLGILFYWDLHPQCTLLLLGNLVSTFCGWFLDLEFLWAYFFPLMLNLSLFSDAGTYCCRECP